MMLKKKPVKSAWHPIKAKPEETRGRSHGASHKKQKINLWPEENMEVLLKEYNSAPAHSKPKVKHLAEKYGIPTLTVRKRVNEIVKGTGHCSGRPRQPKVLSKGKRKLCQAKIVMVKSKPKNDQAKCTCTNQKILFFRG